MVTNKGLCIAGDSRQEHPSQALGHATEAHGPRPGLARSMRSRCPYSPPPKCGDLRST
ncbi:hypothetical protein L0F63_002011, partial [Massospora cicadina]